MHKGNIHTDIKLTTDAAEINNQRLCTTN